MKCEELIEDRMAALYGEADPETLARLSAHEASCQSCREETMALRRTREELQAWGDEMGNSRPRPGQRMGWLLAAASVVLALGGALGLAGTEVGYADGRFHVRLGRGSDLEAQLTRQEARHQAELATLRASLSKPPGPLEPEVLGQVQTIVADSERRQQDAWRTDLARFEERASTARRLDLARVSAGLAYLDRRNSSDAARTAEWMGYVLEASQER